MRNFVQLGNIGPDDERALREAFRDRFGGPPSAFAVEDFGPYVRARTLIAHDRRDTVVGFDQGELFARCIPGARLHATSSLGHRGILRDAEVIAAVVGFVI